MARLTRPPASWSPPRRRSPALFILTLLILGLVIWGFGTLDEVGPVLPDSPFSNGTLYTLHATTATVLDWVGASPVQVVIQWTKASSHAQTPAQVDQAAEGIASVYRQANDQAAVVRATCAIYAHGSPSIHLVVDRAGVDCPH